MPPIRKNRKWRRLSGVITFGLAAILYLPMLFTTSAVSAGAVNGPGARSGMSQEVTNCINSGPTSGEYSVNICLAHHANNRTVNGSVSVTATLDIAGSDPRIRSVAFYLDNERVLTDFEEPYTFDLPTDYFIDGTHRLSVDVLLRDDFVTDQAAITLDFDNGNVTPPVNTNTFTLAGGRPRGPGEQFVVAAVGDGADGQSSTAEVVNLIASWNPNLFLYLGDVYSDGTVVEFVNWYGDETSSFGQFRAITNPTVGNHEYEADSEAVGYYSYWDNIPEFYSFDAAGWHFISLNSTSQLGQTEPGTPQYEWLLQDLTNSTAPCTIAYFHHPVFSLGPHGNHDYLNGIWALLVQHDVEIVLTGHDHNYQRWYALGDDGRLDPNGTTLFVAGTGGHGIREFTQADERVASAYDAISEATAFGALNLKLNSYGLEYRFINVAGDVLDFGVVGCDSAKSDTVSPATPSSLTSGINPAGHVTLKWVEANDNTGVSGYVIYRDGKALVTVDGPTSSYTDTATQVNTTYSYTLRALDPAQNESALSETVTATTPPAASLVLVPVADAYVDMSTPDQNFGSRPRLRSDTSPTVQSYIRFDVPKLSGKVLSATLLVYAHSTSNNGHEVYEVSQTDWDETGISYNSAPPLGRLIGSSEPFESDTWVSVDVTALVTGEVPLSLALVTTSNTNTSYSSREGTNPAQLIIELGTDAPPDANR